MRPKDLFGVVVRTVGLVAAILSVLMVGGGLLDIALGGPGKMTIFLVIGFPLFLFGMVFLSGAKALVDWAYREEQDP